MKVCYVAGFSRNNQLSVIVKVQYFREINNAKLVTRQ